MKRRALPCLMTLVMLTACSSAERGSDVRSSVSPPSSTLIIDIAGTKCAVTRVHRERDTDLGRNSLGIPWVQAEPASSGIYGHLFYYNSYPNVQYATMPPHGVAPDGQGTTKILWVITGNPSPVNLRVTGRRIGGSDSLEQTFDKTGGNQYPSIINVPSPGCWQLQLTRGVSSGSVTVLVQSG